MVGNPPKTSTSEMMRHKAGDAVWGTPTTHTEENPSNHPFEVVAIELKS
jgi:hypothetical protein